MSWVSHPFKEHKRRSIILIVFLFFLWIGLYHYFGWLALFLGILLVGSAIYPYFIRTTYTLDDKKIKIKGLFMEKEKEWFEFRSYYPDRNGVLLSPFTKPSRLENFRGTYLRFSGNRAQVIEFVSHKIKKET
jgi:hypothetical protein